jgi:nucleoside-diphosphate-sugar epimerase
MQRFGKPRLLIIGCGDVGLRLLALLREKYKVFALTSSLDRFDTLRKFGAIPIYGDLDQASSLWRLSQLAPYMIHLAPPPQQGSIDTRTRNLLRILSQQSGFIRQLTYISTTGVYGDCKGAVIDETYSTQARTARALRRVSAEAQIRAWGVAQGVKTTILRVPGIYAQTRLPVDRLKKGMPALSPQDDVFTNHIHADDLARLISYAMYRAPAQRVFNACDSSDLKMGDYFDLVARAFDLPKAPRLARSELEKILDPMMLSFMSESRRIQNHRLDELRFRFQYPTVESFLSSQTE